MPTVSLPNRLGRLERVERLGAGGFATVWRYHDPELDSDVAVKALAENWAQRLDVRERFVEEARILRRADSDHVVRVHDIGEAEGTPYFVMTFADLGSLADVLEDGVPLDPARVLDLATQAGIGLSMLHEQGVVHRDVKPQNLLLRSGGPTGERVLVADLGVAKAMLHASGLTQVVGTPSFMAPEQAVGIGIDARADVHALAAVTYRMLTGELVRSGTVAELAGARLPAAPSSLVDVPGEVDDVLLGALEPDPANRVPDVATFVLQLRAALSGVVEAAPDREALTVYALPRPRTRTTPGTWALVVVALLVLVATFGVGYTLTSLVR